TPEKLEEMKKRGVTRAYAVSGLCYLVMAYVLALLASFPGDEFRAGAVARLPPVARLRRHDRSHGQCVLQQPDRGLGDRRRLPARLSAAHGRGRGPVEMTGPTVTAAAP